MDVVRSAGLGSRGRNDSGRVGHNMRFKVDPVEPGSGKIVLLSQHVLDSARRAGFHWLADAFWRAGWDVTFVTTGISQPRSCAVTRALPRAIHGARQSRLRRD